MAHLGPEVPAEISSKIKELLRARKNGIKVQNFQEWYGKQTTTKLDIIGMGFNLLSDFLRNISGIKLEMMQGPNEDRPYQRVVIDDQNIDSEEEDISERLLEHPNSISSQSSGTPNEPNTDSLEAIEHGTSSKDSEYDDSISSHSAQSVRETGACEKNLHQDKSNSTPSTGSLSESDKDSFTDSNSPCVTSPSTNKTSSQLISDGEKVCRPKVYFPGSLQRRSSSPKDHKDRKLSGTTCRKDEKEMLLGHSDGRHGFQQHETNDSLKNSYENQRHSFYNHETRKPSGTTFSKDDKSSLKNIDGREKHVYQQQENLKWSDAKNNKNIKTDKSQRYNNQHYTKKHHAHSDTDKGKTHTHKNVKDQRHVTSPMYKVTQYEMEQIKEATESLVTDEDGWYVLLIFHKELASKEDLESIFRAYCKDEKEEIVIDVTKKIPFVKYRSHLSAAKAYVDLKEVYSIEVAKKCRKQQPKKPKTKFLEHKVHAKTKSCVERASLYIGNLPRSYSKADVTQHFEEFNLIESWFFEHLEKDFDFGFMDFDTVEHAMLAKEKMDSVLLDGKTIRIDWAKATEKAILLAKLDDNPAQDSLRQVTLEYRPCGAHSKSKPPPKIRNMINESANNIDGQGSEKRRPFSHYMSAKGHTFENIRNVDSNDNVRKKLPGCDTSNSSKRFAASSEKKVIRKKNSNNANVTSKPPLEQVYTAADHIELMKEFDKESILSDETSHMSEEDELKALENTMKVLAERMHKLEESNTRTQFAKKCSDEPADLDTAKTQPVVEEFESMPELEINSSNEVFSQILKEDSLFHDTLSPNTNSDLIDLTELHEGKQLNEKLTVHNIQETFHQELHTDIELIKINAEDELIPNVFCNSNAALPSEPLVAIQASKQCQKNPGDNDLIKFDDSNCETLNIFDPLHGNSDLAPDDFIGILDADVAAVTKDLKNETVHPDKIPNTQSVKASAGELKVPEVAVTADADQKLAPMQDAQIVSEVGDSETLPISKAPNTVNKDSPPVAGGQNIQSVLNVLNDLLELYFPNHIPKQYSPGSCVSLAISRTFGGGFFFALPKEAEDINEIQHITKDMITNKPHASGDRLCCIVKDDDVLYRAFVIDSDPTNDQEKLFLIDFGWEELTERRNMKALPERYRTIPPLALLCHIEGSHACEIKEYDQISVTASTVTQTTKHQEHIHRFTLKEV